MPRDLTILHELANIGAAHAATALAELFGARVDMTPPVVHEMGLAETADELGTNLDEVMAALLRLEGGLAGLVVLITSDHEAILDRLGMPGVGGRDVIPEAGNIVASKLAVAIGKMIAVEGHPTPPAAGGSARATVVEAVLGATAFTEPIVMARSMLSMGDGIKIEILFFPDLPVLETLESIA